MVAPFPAEQPPGSCTETRSWNRSGITSNQISQDVKDELEDRRRGCVALVEGKEVGKSDC